MTDRIHIFFVALLAVLIGCGDDSPPTCDDCGDAGPTFDGGDAGAPPDAGPVPAVTILRDEFGVPHIFAEDPGDAAYAWGWVDAQDQGPALIAALLSAEGRSLERFGAGCGAACLSADTEASINRVPESVAANYDTLDALTRAHLERYADGLNDYFSSRDPMPAAHRADDPITAQMLVAAQMVAKINHAVSATQNSPAAPGGSNQFAVTGARTAADTTLLVKDPHNRWSESEPYVHLRTDGLDIVGNAALGINGCGSNSAVGFGCTRSAPVSAVYVETELRYLGMDPGTMPCGEYARFEYRDHAAPSGFSPVEVRCISVATGDSGLDGDNWLYETRFGPILQTEDTTPGDSIPDVGIVRHVFAATDVTFVDYLVARTFARSPREAMELYAAPTPREDAQYRAFAGADGTIGIVLGAATPGLAPTIDWTARVNADDPRIDAWTDNLDWSDMTGVEWHNVDGMGLELPSVMNPTGDFVQNCNGNPGFATEPIDQVGVVAPYLERSRGASERDRSLRAHLIGATDIDSTRAIEIAGDIEATKGRRLGEAIACGITAEGLTDLEATYGDGGVLMQQLADWSAEGFAAAPTSTAMTILYLLQTAVGSGLNYPASGACTTRAQLDGLAAALDGIATYMTSTYSAQPDPLRVPWGHLNYATIGGVEVGLPGASGSYGTLFVSFFGFDAATGRATGHGGSRLPQVTAWTPAGFETWITVPHGQISETVHPESPHIGQTIDDFVARRFRRMWLEPDEVRSHLCPWGDPASPQYDPAHEHPAVTTLDP